jgi:nucleotide-binding universal stress UspA family protein
VIVKILVAVDGSSYTKRMLAYLAAHDEWLGPAHQYTIVHSTPNLPPRAKAYFDRATLAAYSEDEFEQVFKPIRAFFSRHAMDVTFTGKTGPAAEVIATLAQKGKFDLLVMGSHGHGALGSLVMGSVVTKVMATCTTPILIVR